MNLRYDKAIINNRRNLLVMMVFLSFIFLTTTVWGASPKLRIGYVDLQKALNVSEAGREAKERFKKEVKKSQEEVGNRQKELKKLQEDLAKKAAILKKSVKEEKEKELQNKTREFRQFVLRYENELRRRENELTRGILKELRVIIQEYAKEKGYTYVFERSEGGIIYAPDSDDLTEEIIKIYNRRYRSSKK